MLEKTAAENSKCSKIEAECLSCGKCVKNCIMLNEYVNDPKQFFRSYNTGETADIIIPYSCLVCGYCKTVCPKELNLGEGFMEIRNFHVLENGGKPPLKELGKVDMHQKLSFSRFFTLSPR